MKNFKIKRNPEIQRNSKIYKNPFLVYFLTVLVCVVCSCTKGNDGDSGITLKSADSVTLHSGETSQIEATSSDTINYSTQNKFNATVSKTGLIKANYVGKTTINLKNSHGLTSVKVAVIPRISLYPEPYIFKGMMKSDVIAKYGQPNATMSSAIAYTAYSAKAPILMYTFNQDGSVMGASVTVSTTYTEDLSQHMAERYFLYKTEGSTFTYINGLSSNLTLWIILKLYNTNTWLVSYIPSE